MSRSPLSLTLLIPGLVGPFPGMGQPGFPMPRWPALAKLLARADRHAVAVSAETLPYRLFGYAPSDTHDHPDAWLNYQVDTGAVAPGAILRADPVHLRADQHRVLLFDADHLQIAADEAQALIAAFNQLYAAEGLWLEASTPTRWYLHLPKQPELRTTPLARVMGRDIDPHLPSGHEARAWRQRVNEVQMLFHDHPVNRAREMRGQPLINSVWLWGGGRPVAAVAQDWQRVWSRDIVMQGLARLNGLRCSDAVTDAQAWLREVVDGRHLVSLELLRPAVAYGDVASWLALVEQSERAWFAPLLAELRTGRLRELWLYPADGHVYRVTRWNLWRVWRRQRSMSAVLD